MKDSHSEAKQQQQFIEITTQKLLNLEGYPHLQLFEGCRYPWQALARVPAYLSKVINQVPQSQRNKGKTIGSVFVDENVLVGQGTVIQHGAMIKGPAIIGKNCQLRKGCYVRGNAIIGDGCVIGNSTQIKHSIIFDKAEICHFNYVGDSILAQRAHMAAGAITSNLKLDSSLVKVHLKERKIQTGMLKFGAFIGEHSQIGCNVVLNPGSIIGRESVVYPSASFRGYLPTRHILKIVQSQQEVVRL